MGRRESRPPRLSCSRYVCPLRLSDLSRYGSTLTSFWFVFRQAAEYEKETGQTITFTIPSRAVARVLGKAGSQINEIKEETDTQIDVDKADSSTPTTSIT